MQLRRSRRRNFFEARLLPLFLIRPYRCSNCGERQYGIGFHRLRRRISVTALALILLAGILSLAAGAVYLVLVLATQT